MSVLRRQNRERQNERRFSEHAVRCRVATICNAVQEHGVPVVHVTRMLTLSERTARRWRHGSDRASATRGRPPRPATRDQRNIVFRFLNERGVETPLAALRAAFRDVRRTELQNVLTRYRRLQRRKARRHQSRLEWRQTGTVWAADFKERREPIEGRYAWILAVKDLASRYQLAWQPVEEASAEVVQAMYARLCAEHGPPLVMKSDNGGPFKADATKRLLAERGVTALFNPRRRPGYNGGIERANAQLAGYQESLAAFSGRAGLPTCADAQAAQRLANELARPDGWRGLTAAELWQARPLITPEQRADFLAAVAERRTEARTQLGIAADERLDHFAQAAVDRRAVRDALVARDLLRIHPRHAKRGARAACDQSKSRDLLAQPDCGAGTIEPACVAAAPTFDAAQAPPTHATPRGQQHQEEATSSTDTSSASGQD
jgi:transposase InsO family protein